MSEQRNVQQSAATALGDAFLLLGVEDEPLSDRQKAVIRQTVLSALEAEPLSRGERIIEGRRLYSAAWIDAA